jgi:hypothetical protein
MWNLDYSDKWDLHYPERWDWYLADKWTQKFWPHGPTRFCQVGLDVSS